MSVHMCVNIVMFEVYGGESMSDQYEQFFLFLDIY